MDEFGRPKVLYFNSLSRNDRWHTEISALLEPPRYSLLHQHETPGGGKGDTIFADMRAAYADPLSSAVLR